MSKKKVLIVGGMAQSGKSTTMRILKGLGYEALSTSQLLHNVANSLTRELGDFPSDLVNFKDKSLVWSVTIKAGNIETTKHLTSREFLIKLAEGVLVPNYGRKSAFVNPIGDLILQSDSDKFAIESIGGTEFELLSEMLLDKGLAYDMINVRRYTEQASADYREFLPTPALHVWNNFDTIEEWKSMLTSILGSLGE